MTLREWMKRERLTQVEAAKRLGITQPTISALLKGAALPTLQTANKVRLGTSGAVHFEDWLTPEERTGAKPTKAGKR